MRGREAILAWLLPGLVGVAVLVTYARLPAADLYHVSGSGLRGGAGRALVYVDFPVALVAIAILALSLERLRGGVRLVALASGLLCAVVFWPGVVDEDDLDARWVNALPATGVAVAVLLTPVGEPGRAGRPLGDRLRLALAVLVLLAAPVWAAADLGFFLDGVPLLGWLYESGPASAPAVHRGHHHGMDGILLVLCALLLSRLLPTLRSDLLRLLAGAYLALMLAYGAGNVANDFWNEQVVVRGWSGWEFPSVLHPGLTWAWAAVAGGALAVWVGWFSRERPEA
ncbi:MAG TPA: hypothetical protein VFB42_05615 [Gaiellaceae bacterium]|nr:hypothetical protein [Gaiellaceae bacterium]